MQSVEQLLQCPWCDETQPAESARWDHDGLAYETICQTCCKKFMGFVFPTCDLEPNQPAVPPRS